MKRVGARGAGKWERTSWDEVLETFGSRIRKAIQEERGEEVMYHVGRPGHDFIMERTLQAWGIDGHNSHTNVCSSSARLGYLLWHYADRPSPDHANARFILLLSAHLESGHYFNPHAQRIIDGKMAGAKLAVMDPRLSNTASMADYWMPTYPGTEAAVLLAMAKVILDENRFDATFVKNWTNWEELEVDGFKAKGQSFEALIEVLKKHYAKFTPQFAEKESGVKADVIVKTAREIATAGSRFASHLWRGSASGNLGGWQPARALMLLHVLTGSVGTEGGHNLNAWNKFVPKTFKVPPPQKRWNELLYPREWPLCTHEMSFLLPHFLKEGRGRIEAYFTRVFNPVWTYPDGFSWIEMLRDEEKVGLHAALTPTWSETAWFADYVLPMGFSSERHDLMSMESYAGKWIGFRQPVNRVLRERAGEKFEYTYQANPGEVWEEDEFWTNLSWEIDPDGSMGIRQYFESPYRPGEKLTVDDYYGWIFDNSVPGLPETAKKEGLTPLQYMRKYGAFEITRDVYKQNEKPVAAADLADSKVESNGVVTKEREAGWRDGRRQACRGLQHAFAQAGTVFENHGRLEMAGVHAARVLPQPHSSLSTGGFAGRSAGRFRSEIHAGGRVAEGFSRRGLYAAADFSAAKSDSYAVGQREVSLRDLAQESAVGQPDRRQETWRRAHGRSDEGSHRDRLLRAARLGYGGSNAGSGCVFASSRALAD